MHASPALEPRPVAAPDRVRHDRLDAWRGLSMVWMACFHFSFDLNMNGLLTPWQNFYLDPFWTTQRFCIVSMFLLGAGASQAVAIDAGQGWPRFWRRWAQIAAGAVLVSLGTLRMFPDSWISFGVLHGLAVMLIALRWIGRRAPPASVARRPFAFAALALLGGVAWTLPKLVQSPFFDTRLTDWAGLVTHLPVTEDYVPVLPWFGMLLAGYLAATVLLVHARSALTAPVPAGLRPLAALGRWSLVFYLVHQPILIGSLLLFRWMFP